MAREGESTPFWLYIYVETALYLENIAFDTSPLEKELSYCFNLIVHLYYGLHFVNHHICLCFDIIIIIMF